MNIYKHELIKERKETQMTAEMNYACRIKKKLPICNALPNKREKQVTYFILLIS